VPFNELEILSYPDPIYAKKAAFINFTTPICGVWFLKVRGVQ
jgi:hypothetical protein